MQSQVLLVFKQFTRACLCI